MIAGEHCDDAVCFSEFLSAQNNCLIPVQTFDTVTQVEALMNYGEALTEDYQRWTVAAAILEAAERFTSQENEPALQEFQLVVGGMKALAENRYEPTFSQCVTSDHCVGSSRFCPISPLTNPVQAENA